MTPSNFQKAPLRVALIGECMIELQDIPGKGMQQTFGGDTLNTAVYMARIGRDLGLTVDYVTALGDDPLSQAMMEFWEKENVGSTMVQRIEGKLPGIYYIHLDQAGERYFHYWRGESAARRCFEYDGSDRILSRLEAYDAVYLSGISLAILEPASLERLMATLEALHDAGRPIFFDFNYRPHLWPSEAAAKTSYARITSLAHTVLLNKEEGELLLDQKTVAGVHSVLHEAGVKESVIRDGEAPCSISCDDELHKVAAQESVRVVDTTAAGDSFSAAYLVARMFGRDVGDAAALAHRLAASVISSKGAVIPLSAMPFADGTFADQMGKK